MNKVTDNFLRFLLTITLLTLAAGCSKDKSDLYAYIEQSKTKHVGSVEPVPQFAPYESFTYSAGDLRDPFVATVDLEDEEAAAEGPRPEKERPRQPLEMFPLDTLSMVGTLKQDDNTWGLIKDPKNVVHRVQVGNYMGQNEGRVIEITETDIILVEIVPDGIGGYIERDASIAIGNE